ncbi:hypothetical protein BVC80_9093g155 [Macleaya cordata]|uniref:Uncharacterized protein n=1 Tax=Macleaya cordata TaxID=56857 RepID=A0A200PX49_MACCD|nr:hypothetical protein BVC80_9093g155 [Macleaya cordata]
MSILANELFRENADSDSEANSDDGPDYYQPISDVVDDEEADDEEADNSDHAFDSLASENPNFQSFSNGHIGVQNGIYTLDLNDDEEEEEEMMGEDPDSAISRAFREDESRRNAPLTPENSTRIMDAMRGISLEGFAPDWTAQVPEDRWIDQLRRIRQPPSTTTSTSQN